MNMEEIFINIEGSCKNTMYIDVEGIKLEDMLKTVRTKLIQSGEEEEPTLRILSEEDIVKALEAHEKGERLMDDDKIAFLKAWQDNLRH